MSLRVGLIGFGRTGSIVASEIISFEINGDTVKLVKNDNSVFNKTIKQYLSLVEYFKHLE